MMAPTREKVRAALVHLSPDLPRDDWAKIGMAIKAALGDEGFPIFDEWSKDGQSYKPADCRDTWKSIRPDGRVTVGTLFYLAEKQGFRPDRATHPETEAERQARQQRQQQQARKDAEAEARKRAAAALAARRILDQADYCHTHAYLSRKGVQPVAALRVIDPAAALAVRSFGPAIKAEAGPWLLVPMMGTDGELCGVEAIDAEGGKGFMGTGKKGLFLIGAPEPGKPLTVVEGLATGLSIHQATGYAVAVAFDCGGLKRTAEAVRAAHPAVRLLIAGDRGNGEEKAREAAAAVSAALVIPVLPVGAGGTDFNDLAAAAGPEAVRAQLAAALPPRPSSGYRLLTADDLDAIPPQRYRIKSVLPISGVAAIFGPSGSGKSFLGFDMAGAIAGRGDWFGYRVKPAPVVYLCLEGEGGLRNRRDAYRQRFGVESLAGVRFVVQPFDLLTQQSPGALIVHHKVQTTGFSRSALAATMGLRLKEALWNIDTASTRSIRSSITLCG